MGKKDKREAKMSDALDAVRDLITVIIQSNRVLLGLKEKLDKGNKEDIANLLTIYNQVYDEYLLKPDIEKLKKVLLDSGKA